MNTDALITFFERDLNKLITEITLYKNEEKKMFGGLAFKINGKMCVNVSADKLMCKFNPNLEEEITEKEGYEPMIMKENILKGYCYVYKEGFRAQKDFEYC